VNRPIHFEFNSPEPDKTCDFFKNVFGWSFNAWESPEEYFLATTGQDAPGINGGVMRSRDGQPRTVNTIDVESVDEASTKIADAGGTVVVPKMAIPGVGWVAYCLDPTGVLFGVFREDVNAK